MAVTPWIPEAAIPFLDSIVKPGMNVFEYGMGRSTIWFLNKGCRLTSVEHAPSWFAYMETLLTHEKQDKQWLPILKIPEVEQDEYQSESYPGFSFKNYVESIDKLNERNFMLFDLILIDGRCRNKCLEKAINHGAYVGYIVFDNSDRPQHRMALEDVKWPRVDIFQGWGCTFFKRGDNDV